MYSNILRAFIYSKVTKMRTHYYTIVAIFVCFLVVVQQISSTANEPIYLHKLEVPPLKHIILVETLANIFSTVVPNTKILQIGFGTNAIDKADLFDLENMLQYLFQKNYYQFVEMDPQHLPRELIEIQRHVIIVFDTYEGFL